MTDKLHTVLFTMSIVLVTTLLAGVCAGLFHRNAVQPIINDYLDHSCDIGHPDDYECMSSFQDGVWKHWKEYKAAVGCGHGPINVISLPVNPPYGTGCVVKDLHSCSTGRILQAHSFTINDKILDPDLIGGGKIECTLATLGPGIWITLEKPQKGEQWVPIISGPTGYTLMPSTTEK